MDLALLGRVALNLLSDIIGTLLLGLEHFYFLILHFGVKELADFEKRLVFLRVGQHPLLPDKVGEVVKGLLVMHYCELFTFVVDHQVVFLVALPASVRFVLIRLLVVLLD